MRIVLNSKVNNKNQAGQSYELLDLKLDQRFARGVAVRVLLNGQKKPVWMTIDWFLEVKKESK